MNFRQRERRTWPGGIHVTAAQRLSMQSGWWADKEEAANLKDVVLICCLKFFKHKFFFSLFKSWILSSIWVLCFSLQQIPLIDQEEEFNKLPTKAGARPLSDPVSQASADSFSSGLLGRALAISLFLTFLFQIDFKRKGCLIVWVPSAHHFSQTCQSLPGFMYFSLRILLKQS